MSTEAEPRVLREVVLSQLATGESRAYKMWLPPLTDPTPVNELVERDYQRRPLRFGLGIMDEPRRHRQEVWGVDVSAAGGNIAVGGAPQTGKSTFLQTLVVSAAATHTPRQVQFYCVDLGGGGLMYLEDLPHVGGVATCAEPTASTVSWPRSKPSCVLVSRCSSSTASARSRRTARCATIRTTRHRKTRSATSSW